MGYQSTISCFPGHKSFSFSFLAKVQIPADIQVQLQPARRVDGVHADWKYGGTFCCCCHHLRRYHPHSEDECICFEHNEESDKSEIRSDDETSNKSSESLETVQEKLIRLEQIDGNRKVDEIRYSRPFESLKTADEKFLLSEQKDRSKDNTFLPKHNGKSR